ncbi:MAG: 3'-5' exoribonuclease YhaM family protein [Acidobacteriota bacterium]
MSRQPTLPANIAKRYVAELAVGEQVRSIFLLNRCDVRTTQRGVPYLALELSDKSGHIPGRLWNGAERAAKQVRAGQYVLVDGVVDTWQSSAQLKVERLEPVETSGIDPSDFLPAAAGEADAMYRELLELVATVRNEHLSSLLQAVFGDPEISARFRRAPGGVKLHHAYLGGLLEHTLSVVKLACKVAEHYTTLDRDLLVAGACLHDLGKIWELSYERAFDYTEEGRLVGHLLLETDRVSNLIDRLDEFPASLKSHLLHLLASHHGIQEHGAPVLPVTPEALALHYLDDLDSKMAAMESAISSARATGASSAYSPSLGRRILRRRWDQEED